MTATAIPNASAATALTRVGGVIRPLDVMLFRDGRPFAVTGRASGGLPTPQTLLGAVRTWLLRRAECDFQQLGERTRKGQPFAESLAELIPGNEWIAHVRTRGPWLAGVRNGQMSPLVPVPADVVKIKDQEQYGRLRLLAPPDLPGFRPPQGYPAPDRWHPLWWPTGEQTERASGFLTSEGLKHYLLGKVPTFEHVVTADRLYTFESRTSVKIQVDQFTAAEGELFSVDFLRLYQDVSFYCEIDLPADSKAQLPTSDVISFGGEGRQAELSVCEPFPWAELQPAELSQPLYLLTTPAFCHPSPNWLPTGLPTDPSQCPIAAAVANPLAISGWDLAQQGPKPVRFAAPAGSVYFFAPNSQLPNPTTLVADAEHQQAGFGAYLRGTATHGNN